MREPLTDLQVVMLQYAFAWPTRPLTYHEWTWPGKSRCGFRWTLGGMRISDKEHRAIAVHTTLAERIGRPCQRCYRAAA